ncbi:MAG: cryptochrome/photolyase family protein [Candidatus Woesearchaeota archaeon]
MSLGVFIFRRDLRLEDNTGLIEALKVCSKVIPIFIFDNKQRNHDYFSYNSFEFMINSLKELDKSLKSKGSKLYVFEGDPKEVLASLKNEVGISKVFVNEDYTPFSKRRDAVIKSFCEDNSISFVSFFDLLLQRPGKVVKDNGEPYSVFTPFYNRALEFDVTMPQRNDFNNYFSESVSFTCDFPSIDSNEHIAVKGGRKEAFELLESAKDISNYSKDRDFPIVKGTTLLSAHHKFGTLSIRESYYFIKENIGSEALLRELYWRDFYTHLAFFNPEVFGHNFKRKYDVISWNENKELLESWKKGMTGFPIVDAGMRQLNSTGYMHNRVRMIVSSFLTKNLLIDWKEGEKYFAQKLVDYDPCVNNGSWQWAASTGADAQPYFRIFNPWSQGEKFDKDAKYIKKWVEELKHEDPKVIHNAFKHKIIDYPGPIIDYKESRKIALEEFKKA